MELVHLDEGNLWKLFKNGNEKAYGHIYSVYFDQLYNYGRKYSTDETLIEDAIHDLFLKMWNNRSNLGNPQSIKNYLFKAFRHHLVDKLNRNQRQVLGLADDMPFEITISPESEYIKAENAKGLNAKVGKAISCLTDRQREVIFLRYYEEFSYPQIAEIMQLGIKATYKLMARAIAALRENLNTLNTFLFMLFSRMGVKSPIRVGQKK